MWFKKKLPTSISIPDLYKLTANVGSYSSTINLILQYENAVDILINHIFSEKFKIDAIAFPLVYLMRHSIELGLKENIKYLERYSNLPRTNIKTHNLDKLFKEFKKHYDKVESENNFDDLTKNDFNKSFKDLEYLIQNLGKSDSSFRYIYETKNNRIFDYSNKINIYDLKSIYDVSILLLTHTQDLISPYTDYIDYLNFDYTIKNKSLGFVLKCVDIEQKKHFIEMLNKKYQLIKKNIWFDKEKKYFLHLKFTNEKCYLIPMKS